MSQSACATLLWVIKSPDGSHWTDDEGGDLFVSYRMAERTLQKWLEVDAEMQNFHIAPANLDDDLAQMCKLYNEANNKTQP